MARLHEPSVSEDELPELSAILVAPKHSRAGSQIKQSSPRKEQRIMEDLPEVLPRNEDAVPKLTVLSPIRTTVKAAFDDKQVRKQKPLRLAHVNSLLLPATNELSKSTWKQEASQKDTSCNSRIRDTPRRVAAQKGDFGAFVTELRDTLEWTEDEASFDDLSDFIVNDSASEEERKRPRPIRKDVRRSPKKIESHTQNSRNLVDAKESEDTPVTIDLISPEKPCLSLFESMPSQELIIDNVENMFNEDPCAYLQFSPPRSRSPCKLPQGIRFVTPPPSPSKPKLQSPTKSKPRVPPSPHRPSLDAFWSADVINDWNDQHSPKKTPKPHRLFPVAEEDEGNLSPSESPRKSPIKSPRKDKQAIERRKQFDIDKHTLASTFLQELDQTVADGKVATLAASTGGIHIIWSKKLNSTAGRANWRREATRSKKADGTTADMTYRHHASIELAEKVIDDEDRLLNVLAHEYCHLANFMISNVKNNPHGKEFKQWAHRVSTAFSHRHIHVTTKHSYVIAYKYIWACTLCGVEFKRHSRSIDPARHTCGSCKGKLVQVQPAPRGGPTGEDGRKVVGGYQAYVKENYARFRRENKGLGMGEVMALLGRGYREGKEREVVEVEVVEVGSRGEDEGREVERGLDAVARKLDFLSLGGAGGS